MRFEAWTVLTAVHNSLLWCQRVKIPLNPNPSRNFCIWQAFDLTTGRIFTIIFTCFWLLSMSLSLPFLGILTTKPHCITFPTPRFNWQEYWNCIKVMKIWGFFRNFIKTHYVNDPDSAAWWSVQYNLVLYLSWQCNKHCFGQNGLLPGDVGTN